MFTNATIWGALCVSERSGFSALLVLLAECRWRSARSIFFGSRNPLRISCVSDQVRYRASPDFPQRQGELASEVEYKQQVISMMRAEDSENFEAYCILLSHLGYASGRWSRWLVEFLFNKRRTVEDLPQLRALQAPSSNSLKKTSGGK